MEKIKEFLTSVSTGNDIAIGDLLIPANMILFAVLLLAAFGVHQVAVRIFHPLLQALSSRTKTSLDDILFRRNVVRRAFHLIPATIVSLGLPLIFNDTESDVYVMISKAVNLYYVLIGLAVCDAFLDAVRDVFDRSQKANKVGVNGIIQALKVVCVLAAIILAVSLLAGKSPLYFVSGLGAFTAILMLIFKDPIMGLVAGVQLSTMDLVRKGDWIEIPKHGADGDVIDINLTTVRVQNWDKTIVTIPAYELVSSSFKNWRGMFDSGGRRIKRSMRFNISSVHFLSDEEIEALRKIKILAPYFEKKLAEIGEYNAHVFAGADMAVRVNGRRLTNIGTFRAYAEAYLRSHPGINQNLTLMVRLLEPTEFGVPMEVYTFTSSVQWVTYEGVQSDIFDHLLAIVPEFGLTVYQR